MRVVCMTHENFSGIAVVDKDHPAIGEEITVIGEGVYIGIDCYLFQEYTSPNPFITWAFDKRNYSPVSDIDERELVNTKEEAYV
jgi:hypothetical protein